MRPLLEKISALPGTHGKIVLILSAQESSGAATVARSLNRAAVSRGMLSVMIDVQYGVAGVPACTAAQGVPMTTADLQSVQELLIASKKTAPPAADDIRSEFDLVVIHAPPMSAYPDAAALAAHVDLVILVALENAVGPAAEAAAVLSRFGPAPVGLAINRAAAGAGVADRRRVPRVVAG